MPDFNTLVTALLIFAARIVDVSIGAVRVIVTVQGGSVIAFFLGICEVPIWIAMMSTVIHKINAQAVLARSYAFGYAIGNVTGISLERKLAPGFYHFEADYPHPTGKSLADRIRTEGQPVTVFRGQDMRGPADELYMACRRQELKPLLDIAKAEDPNAFYITEMAREVSKSGRSPYFLFNGRRSVLKRR